MLVDARRGMMLVAVAAAATVTAAGCGAGEEDSAAEVTAVATTTQVADLVRNVGGERVAVEQFLQPGSDPHEYEPRPSDAAALEDAAVVFRSGGGLDDFLDGVIENAGGDAETVTLIDSATAVRADDPHWWQDPRNAVAAAETIADALAAADPAGAGDYRRNAREYAATIERLDQAIGRCMKRVPAAQRQLVTTHDSYGYFADRYDVEILGALIPSASTEAQPSAGETAALVERIGAERVEAIFPESPLDPDLEQVVADEAGAIVGDPLWADSLGPEGSGGATYVGALASDAEAMVAGFTGDQVSCPGL
ncbi:MAG: zinc ABC transporter substrate-binding protein [Thermoleophilaceae bacterium]|nr:zinc ABC transporter substrate-binding protein [Thermoleophilaceae bacterium]